MAISKQLKEELETIESIKLITQALGDIATAQIKQRRESVELNIQYFHEILDLYHIVRGIALKTKEYKDFQKKKNGKTVCILVTSNYKFNGNLDIELTNFFASNVIRTEADLVVLGKLGGELLEAHKFGKPFEKLVLTKDYPTLEELSRLVEKIQSYSRILVFHSKFVTLLNQEPAVTDITADGIEEVKAEKKIAYLLEPEVDKMIRFFEDQILLLLLQAIFLESEIARTAARMVSMNQAEEEAEKLLDSKDKEALKMRKNLVNLRIIESFAGRRRKTAGY